MMRSIALMGRAGAGKDTAAKYLAQVYGYQRIAFADPLRAMALAVDPLVECGCDGRSRLSDVVAAEGWEGAKRRYPEVRRFLQRLGLEGVREHLGDDTWVDIAIAEISRIRAARTPVVVTDVRFRNELAALQRWNFLPVWVDRPGVADSDHASEAELHPWDATVVITNDRGPERLGQRVAEVARLASSVD